MKTNHDIVTPIPGIEKLTYEQANIFLNFQKLWIDTVSWLRNAFHSSMENLPDQTAAEAQLFLKLPTDFYNEFRKYFSEEESQQFLNYYNRLTTNNWHIVNAYKYNDQSAIDMSIAQWKQTASELASFLSGINQYWNENQWETLFNDYLNTGIRLINAFLDGSYDLENKIYNELEDIAVQMAGYMAVGIIEMLYTS